MFLLKKSWPGIVSVCKCGPSSIDFAQLSQVSLDDGLECETSLEDYMGTDMAADLLAQVVPRDAIVSFHDDAVVSEPIGPLVPDNLNHTNVSDWVDGTIIHKEASYESERAIESDDDRLVLELSA